MRGSEETARLGASAPQRWRHLENWKGLGRLLELMATLSPLTIWLVQSFWQGDIGTAALTRLHPSR